MFWSLDSMDEQPFGQLIALFRRRRGLNQADVAPLLARFGFRFPPQLSLLEGGTWQTHPERALIQELARLYSLSPREESYLLRQADIPPSATEQQSIIMRFGSFLFDLSSVACVVNMHWQLVAWNESFADLYDSRGSLKSRTSESKLRHSPFQAAGRSSAFAQAETEQDKHLDEFVALVENMSIFTMLFSHKSRLRAILEPDEWSKIARFLLIRFWRTTLPMFNQHWYPLGQPAWVEQLEDDMRALSAPDNQEFMDMSMQIRRALESDSGWADPHVQLLNNFLYDRLLFRQQGYQLQLIPTVMSDARFLFVQFQRTDIPESYTPTLQDKYL